MLARAAQAPESMHQPPRKAGGGQSAHTTAINHRGDQATQLRLAEEEGSNTTLKIIPLGGLSASSAEEHDGVLKGDMILIETAPA